jgi:cellobiose-specific phosphotransferase system component IIC
LCALSEPISEWNEARTSTQTANTSIQKMYQPKTADYSSWVSGAGVAIVIAILIFLFGGSQRK